MESYSKEKLCDLCAFAGNNFVFVVKKLNRKGATQYKENYIIPKNSFVLSWQKFNRREAKMESYSKEKLCVRCENNFLFFVVKQTNTKISKKTLHKVHKEKSVLSPLE